VYVPAGPGMPNTAVPFAFVGADTSTCVPLGLVHRPATTAPGTAAPVSSCTVTPARTFTPAPAGRPCIRMVVERRQLSVHSPAPEGVSLTAWVF